MPTIHSHGNTNVSKIWFVVVFAFVVLLGISWKVYASLEEIALHTNHMTDDLRDLMDDPH
ncbi:MAG: hypothetical protein AAB460_00480 [Patescibacteria group bacterium]